MEFKVGDFVKVAGQDAIGEIVGHKGKDLIVSFGLLQSTVKADKLKKVDNFIANNNALSEPSSPIIDTREKLINFKFDIDLRGKMKDEVMDILSRQLDDAILLGIKEFRVIHGRGNGVVKTTMKGIFKEYKEISKKEEQESEGITVIKL